jgi:Flp pilus assembly protein TadD
MEVLREKVITGFLLLLVVVWFSHMLTGVYETASDWRPVKGIHFFQNSGIVAYREGNYAKAVRQFDKAVHEQAAHVTQDKWKSYFMMGETYYTVGDEDSALWCWKRAAIYNPHDPNIYNRIARIMIHYGQLGNAEEVIKVGVALDPRRKENMDMLVALWKYRGAM